MEPVRTIRSSFVVMPTTDIDTDQIIPARFLTTTTREGLGAALFNDLRYDANGDLNADFPLNASDAASRQILVAGNNFGCGSSREHAPWALLDFGIRAVISTEIADIFRNNSLKNGLVPVVVDTETHSWLLDNPDVELEIDVASSTLNIPGREPVEFPMDAFARLCLIEGLDQLGYLESQLEAIESFEENRSWRP